MNHDAARTASLWMEVPAPQRAALPAGSNVDVCVIGSGIAGLTTAYRLGRLGKKVLVLDAGQLGGVMSARTTAHLANAIDDRYTEIERIHGTDGARLAAESHTAAIDFIEATARDEQIACDFERVTGYLFLGPGDKESLLDEELAAAHRAGLREVAKLPVLQAGKADLGPCLGFPRQGQFHPMKYLNGLMQAIERDGGELRPNTRVKWVEPGSPVQVETADGDIITAGAAVVATNTPFNDRFSIHTKQHPYITYVLAARIHPGAVPHALYWDTLDPYHYVRLERSSGGEYLIVGGEDHKTGQANDGNERFIRLEQWMRAMFPAAGEVTHRWSGQVMETVDGLAFIGRDPAGDENVYVATGDSGMGMTHGTLAGLILADQLTGKSNPWADLYNPGRKRVRSLWEYTKENLNAAAQYTEYVTGGDVSDESLIRPGSGAVVRHGLTKVALYRDESGELHECSAVCPHLGGIVRWNDTEKTWDCPVHGSRFDKCGHVLQGPAAADLKAHERV